MLRITEVTCKDVIEEVCFYEITDEPNDKIVEKFLPAFSNYYEIIYYDTVIIFSLFSNPYYRLQYLLFLLYRNLQLKQTKPNHGREKLTDTYPSNHLHKLP